MFSLKPIGKRLIIKAIKVDPQAEAKSGKLILITKEEKTLNYEVISVGDDGCPVEIGDLIRVGEYDLRPFKIPGEIGEDYFLIRYEDILAKLTT